MNKKFILISLSIFILSFVFILGFKFVLGDKVLYEDAVNYEQGKPTIKYVGFEEDENIYKIKVSIKNNSDYYANFYDINLQFSNSSSVYLGDANPVFKGYDSGLREYYNNYKEGMDEYSSFLDPKEGREYVFEIPKGLSFDKEVFDTNRMTIVYDAKYFKYVFGSKTMFNNVFSRSSVEFIDNSKDPYTIE
jgi:hypothetical protein